MINLDSVQNRNSKRFISHVIRTCIKNRIKFITIPDVNEMVLGGFNDFERTLEITESPSENVLGILVHEYCHMMQWIEKSPLYFATYRGLDPTTVVTNWLEGIEYSERTLDACFLLCKKLEFDCDIRALEQIKKWDLPIDEDRYIKCAIGYSYYYDHLRRTRRQGSNVAYEKHCILKLIKPDFGSRNLEVRNVKIESLIDKHTK